MHLLSSMPVSSAMRSRLLHFARHQIWESISAPDIFRLRNVPIYQRTYNHHKNYHHQVLQKGASQRRTLKRAATNQGKSATPGFSSQAVMNAEASSSTSASVPAYGSHYNPSNSTEKVVLSWQSMRALFVASAVPMVGFGFMDNLVSVRFSKEKE